MTLWFTADTHFGHKNILEYCKRPFKSTEEMNEALIKNWNSVVKKNDTIIVNGDFCFPKEIDYNSLIKTLKGNKIFIEGNHDRAFNVACGDRLTVSIGKETVYVVHHPNEYCKDFKINLVAHAHDKFEVSTRENGQVILVNIGVDVWDYKPVSFEQIMRRVEEFKLAEGK